MRKVGVSLVRIQFARGDLGGFVLSVGTVRKVGASLIQVELGGFVLSVGTVHKVGASLVRIQFTWGDLGGICFECWDCAQSRRIGSSYSIHPG